MITFSRTATATLLALGLLTACSEPNVAPGTSVPVQPSQAPSLSVPPAASHAARSPGVPDNTVPTGAPPSRPAGIPKTPTDIVHPSGWIEGTITRGGTGPCYGMVTFDGVTYAMYSDTGVKLAEGDHIQARLTPAKQRISCGDGIPVSLGAIRYFP